MTVALPPKKEQIKQRSDCIARWRMHIHFLSLSRNKLKISWIQTQASCADDVMWSQSLHCSNQGWNQRSVKVLLIHTLHQVCGCKIRLSENICILLNSMLNTCLLSHQPYFFTLACWKKTLKNGNYYIDHTSNISKYLRAPLFIRSMYILTEPLAWLLVLMKYILRTRGTMAICTILSTLR